ncbi:cation diffusion facilitator family transporter [Algivirga pacifica]|uniref:Cation diffusion facilitator family transporter n=1 Tax=Algivirga pacifica TaxID=1162670 RepID=A0ABP9D5L0_9BACT
MDKFQHNDHHHFIPHTHSDRSIRSAFILNLLFTIFEIAGGIFTNSMAILSDAIHDLGDTFALGMGLYLEKVSLKKEDTHYTYGYRRYSTLAAVINAAVLTTGSIYIVAQTIPRLLKPEEVHQEGMILFAIVGVIVNGAAVFKLKKDHNSANQRVMMLHLMEDVLGWVAVLIGSIIMYFYDVPILDPILSFGIGLYILFNAIKNLKKILPIFLQAIPENIHPTQLRKQLEKIPDVLEVHDLHAWSMDGEFNIMTIHVVVNSDSDLERCYHIKQEIRKILEAKSIQHTTIEIEIAHEHCTQKCGKINSQNS